MTKRIKILTWMMMVFCSCGQSGKLTSGKVLPDLEKVDSIKAEVTPQPANYDSSYYLHTEWKYPDSFGKEVIIQNSYPKGGGQIEPGGLIGYYDLFGTHYGHAVFWTRIINEKDTPIELNINFPNESIIIPSFTKPYFKFFLPPDIPTIEKLPLYNYGLTGITKHLDAHFNDPPKLQKTIRPKEEHIFYISMLMHEPKGTIRTGFVLKEQDLFYKVDFEMFGDTLLPCGGISFKKK